MDDLNPYAAPTTELKPQGWIDEGVWSDGELVMTTLGATMPDRCFKCNAPTTWKLKRNLMWHSPFYYVFVLLGLLPYVLVAILVRHTIKVFIPLCKEHRNRRRKAIAVGWLLALVGFCVVPIVGAVASNIPTGFVTLVCIVVILAGIIIGVNGAQVVTVKRIDKRFVWLKGAGSQFLAELPPSTS